MFNPQSLKPLDGRSPSKGRLKADWVGKIISRIGRAAGVVVSPAKGDQKGAISLRH